MEYILENGTSRDNQTLASTSLLRGRGEEEGKGRRGRRGWRGREGSQHAISVKYAPYNVLQAGARQLQLRDLIMHSWTICFKMIGESSALQLLTLVSMFVPYRTQTAGSK